MTRVYSSLNAALVHNLKNVLESCHITCEVRGEYRRAAMGQVPITESWVELWVVDDDRFEEAQSIITEGEAQHGGRSWKCHACGELIEGQFDQCWHCGASRR